MTEERKITAFDEVRGMQKEQLSSLVKEIYEIGNIDAPKYAKQSKDMKRLFDLEKETFRNWSDQFSNVRIAIEIEVLNRVRKDSW